MLVLHQVNPHALRSHIGKVTRDVGKSTDPVFIKWTCKESQIPFTKKKKQNNVVGRF